MDGLLFLGNLDALDLFQFLDAALHLLGFGRLVAEAVDERFQLLDALALVAVSGFDLLAALLLLRQIFVVVAAVKVNALVPDLDDPVDRHVQKVAVVRNQHVGVGIVREIVFQPVAGFEIEMVGGFVEQQQIGLLQEQLGQRNAHLPAAGKFFGLAVPVVLAKAQAGKHGPDLRIERIAVARLEFVLDAVVALGDLPVFRRRVVHFRHARGQRFHLRFHGTQIVEDRHALGKHAAAGERKSILRQIADGRALGDADACRSRASPSRRESLAAWICRCHSRPPGRRGPWA